MSRVLVVDDEPAICWAFEETLAEIGHDVRSSASSETALEEIGRFAPDVILLDYRLPGMDGLTLLRQFRQSAGGRTPVILMTAFGTLDLAVSAMEEGVYDYLPKPFDLDAAVEVIARALASADDASLKPAPAPVDDNEMIGVSRGMQEVFRRIAMVAPMDVPVLITGESGVGKELVARAIHRYSGRDPQRFVPVCVPALSESVLESELFGHVQGAFTGADRARAGLLAQADQGAAFFDEIGDIPLTQQVKLLRVLEDRRITPVGGDEPIPSSFRVIAATHQSLESMIAQGRFRQDLYYRISVFRIHIPPLRERPEDVAPLACRFLEQAAGGRNLSLAEETLDVLKHRRWRGNVRELRSAVHHAAVVCRGKTVTPDCLPEETPEFAAPQSGCDDILTQLREWAKQTLQTGADASGNRLYEQFLNEFEPPILEEALAAAGGSRKAAAELLGLHRETLRKRLRKHGQADDDQ